MFGETTTFHVKIWNHPIETPIYKQMFQVPGRCHRCNLYNPPAFSLFTRGSTTATSVFSSVVKQELAKSADPPSIHGSPGGGVVQKMPDMTYLLGVFEPAPWEKYAEVKLGIISPGIGMKIKNIWNQHLVMMFHVHMGKYGLLVIPMTDDPDTRKPTSFLWMEMVISNHF